MNPVLRLLRYFAIGVAGAALGLIMAEVFVGLPEVRWWPIAVAFGLLVVALGWVRDRTSRPRR